MIRWGDWPFYALMAFAIGAGQLGRLAQVLEKGGTIGRRQATVELMMLPGLASLGGALAAHHNWAIYFVIASGLTAGWLGLATFRLLVAGVRFFAPEWLKRALDEVMNGPSKGDTQ